LLYSPRFLSASPYAYLFVVAQLLQLFAGVALGLLVGIDRIVAQLSITLIGLVVLASTAWLLTPALGIPGVGAAFVAEGTFVFVASMAMVWKTTACSLLSDAGWMPAVVLVAVIAAGAVSAHYDGFSTTVLA